MVSYGIAQKTALWSAYVFHLLILPALFGLLINYRKSKQYQIIEYEDDSQDTVPVGVFLSHHLWLKHSFMVLLLAAALGSTACIFSAEFYALGVISLWWMGRILRGMLNLWFNKPMPAYTANPSAELA
jgi:uncharacterized membrane protein